MMHVLGWIAVVLGCVMLISHIGFFFTARRIVRQMEADPFTMSNGQSVDGFFTPTLVTGFIVDAVIIAAGVAFLTLT